MTLLGGISPALVIKATLANLLKGGEAKRKGRIVWRCIRQGVSSGPTIERELQKGVPRSAYMVADRVPLFTEVKRTSGFI